MTTGNLSVTQHIACGHQCLMFIWGGWITELDWFS